jgi:hypothetical protein
MFGAGAEHQGEMRWARQFLRWGSATWGLSISSSKTDASFRRRFATRLAAPAFDMVGFWRDLGPERPVRLERDLRLVG